MRISLLALRPPFSIVKIVSAKLKERLIVTIFLGAVIKTEIVLKHATNKIK